MVQPSFVVALPPLPTDTAVQPFGTVAVTEKVALSRGCSLTGYQYDADWGSPNTNAPPEGLRYQPLPPS